VGDNMGEGLALLRLLHSESLLAASVRATAAGQPKPTPAAAPSVSLVRPSVAGVKTAAGVVSTRRGWGPIPKASGSVPAMQVPQSKEIDDVTTDAGSEVPVEEETGSRCAIDEVSVSVFSPAQRFADLHEEEEDDLQIPLAAAEVSTSGSQRWADMAEEDGEEHARVHSPFDEAIPGAVSAATVKSAQQQQQQQQGDSQSRQALDDLSHHSIGLPLDEEERKDMAREDPSRHPDACGCRSERTDQTNQTAACEDAKCPSAARDATMTYAAVAARAAAAASEAAAASAAAAATRAPVARTSRRPQQQHFVMVRPRV